MSLFNLTNIFEFFGVISAIILIAGLYQVGSLVFKIRSINKIISQISETKYQNIFISVNFILLFIYPIILFSKNINFIPILSLILFCFGIFKIFKKLKSRLKFNKIQLNKNEIDQYLVLICIFGLFLLSISPNTHGDSLGYHFVVAKRLLVTGNITPEITHFHTLLAGSGEILIAIGLFFGSEQFGGLIQFSGLISLFGIFKKINNKHKYYYFLLALTSPIILFLASTAKPQLFHICSSTVIFFLYLFGRFNELSDREQKWKIFISIAILIVSINSKFNFIISSSLIGLYIFYISAKNGKITYFISISSLLFVLFYLPVIFWKYFSFGGNFYQYFYSPLPLTISGLKEFTLYLFRYGREANYLNIIIPSNFNQFTNSIGLAIFYIFILNLKNNLAKVVFLLSVSYLIIIYFFGQFIGRSFLEPLFWILLVTAKFGTSIKVKFFEYFCRSQAIIVIFGIIYGVLFLFPGSLTNYYKDKVLSQNASGYSLFKWANEILDENEVLFSTHKSISLGNSEYISTEFTSFVPFDNNENAKIYIDEISRKNPKLLLTWGSDKNPFLGRFKNCIGKLKYYKNSIGRHEARNPFNRGSKYNGFIYEFEISKFPKCLEKK